MIAVIESRLKQLEAVCLKRNVLKLYSFGSINTNEYSDQSDVDLLVEFKRIDIEDYADNYLDMCYDLEQIFQRKVDLLTVGSIKNPIFKEEVESTKQIIYSN